MMTQSVKNQALDAESAAKLKIQAALEIELAEIDETNNELDQEIVKRSVQYKIFKNITITKGEKLLDDVRNVHESWLAETERTAQHRTRLAEMLSTKMTNMEEEERQLKMHIAEQELEDAQLQATIAEMTESIETMKPKSEETKAEIDKVKGLRLSAEKHKTDLGNILKGKKEVIKAGKVNCIQGNDEIQLLKEKYAEVQVEENQTAHDLKRFLKRNEDLEAERIRGRYLIEVKRKHAVQVADEAELYELKLNSELEDINSEKANLLAEQEAQQLAYYVEIEHLTSQLQSVKNEVANLECQRSVLRMQSNCQSPPEQAVLSMRIAHSTPLSQVSSTTCSSPDISPIFRKPLVRNIKLYVPSNLQIPHQQAPTSREIQQRFDNRNNNEKTFLRPFPSHSRSDARNQ